MAFQQFNKMVAIRRRYPATLLAGVYTETAPPDLLMIPTSVQPMPSKELQLLTEGRRTTGGYVLYTKADLRLEDVAELDDGDYEVVKLDIWDNGVIPHRKAYTLRMQAEGSL